MYILELAAAGRGDIDQVGGKAVGLGEISRAGERVPAGFVVTTDAHATDVVPEAELIEAYDAMGGGPVAVRSSATAEDLPDASFAGQQETYLNVEGHAALVDAVRKCWDSLHTERAAAYRASHGFDEATMAVVVQRMVDARVAGVLFTANPMTGTRTEMVVDAARGLGTSVVDGTVNADHYVLGADAPTPEHGCVTPAELRELRAAGTRMQELFGTPQDIEWAIDADDVLWLLQSRPVTTLFPTPAHGPDGQVRALMEFSQKQGMRRPFTPMGFSLLRTTVAALTRPVGIPLDPDRGPDAIVELAGRIYLDITAFLRDPKLRRRLDRTVTASIGSRAGDAIRHLLTDSRFAAGRDRSLSRRAVAAWLLRYGPAIASDTVASLLRPDAARRRISVALEAARADRVPPPTIADPAVRGRAAARIQFVRSVQDKVAERTMRPMTGPLVASLLSQRAPRGLLRGLASDDEIDATLRGMPHNVTTTMDLELWRIAAGAGEHRRLLVDTDPAELARRYDAGQLPEFGLAGFLARYGHRGAAEIDVGVPHWGEDPTPVFAAIANYLRIDDPTQAPDLRFERAARDAEAHMARLVARARRSRPVRGTLAGFFLRRARELSGIREDPKFAWVLPLPEIRRQLLLVGEEMAETGALDRGEDVMFLHLAELSAVVDRGDDLRKLVAARRAEYDREMRRHTFPTLLLSDGTDVEAVLPRPRTPDGALVGLGAAPGRVTGRARVVHDPSSAQVEPGEILVAPTTDPGWTPLFLTAGGLVTETGAPMAHGPTVAREYGIPAIVGIAEATQRITTGQPLTIDGATGVVTLEEELAATETSV
ncbi:pyruvate, water dikinase [Spiractinospora alimapuensis]|uniref:PEP/pyruvate-binding domain-containing protein n=1 Tax=Spiractinospora alimapuensis TaxID=2820884 RepID=UPI001EEA9F71|nr:PEP/pyruvate-binding domain-containing protein [Spiractinospora alimapuensis]QVQ52461.1 pyruvate, water dikinase [Spiractinospora alimapuensis]